jgi:hypothetical protein
LYLGGLAICGPIGDFGQQINYWGDFRALYDYFSATAKFHLHAFRKVKCCLA